MTSRRAEVGRALLAVYEAVARTDAAVLPALEEYGISTATAHLLWLIDPDEPGPTMRVAAARAGCTPQNVTYMCQQLERRELAMRMPSPADQRQRVIELTDRGREAREAIAVLVEARSPFARMSIADLRRLAGALDATP